MISRMACGGAVLAVALVLRAAAQEAGAPATTETDIAWAAATVLAGAQVSEPPLDDRLSTRFLNGYLDALDASHLVFLQPDLDEFAWFRPDLARLALAEGEVWPAHLIYTRFLARLADQVNFQTNFLQTAQFQFGGHDTWQRDRRDLMRPPDLAAARALWQEEVRADYLQEKLAGLPPSEIVRQLTRRYERRFQIAAGLKSNELLEIYLDELAHAFDPHSDYFGHQDAQEFAGEVNQSVVGIGGSLESKDGSWVVGDLTPGSPAERSGLLHPGDRILAVAQDGGEPEEVSDLPSWRVVNLIRGPRGSNVQLTIVPAGQADTARKIVSLVREDVKLTGDYPTASVVGLPQAEKPGCRMGVIKLPLFYEGSGASGTGASADAARLIRRLKRAGVAGLILDLRGNPGGSLAEAIKLTGLFIPAGPVLQTRNAMGRMEVVPSPEINALYTGPLVVLTSRLSASSSEVVAGALQDYGRAVIVGDSATFGKGTAQILIPLKKLLHSPGFGAVKVTVAEFYRPSGITTQFKGVLPDIVLPSFTDLPGIGEAQYQNALPWNSVSAAAYTRLDLVRPVLAPLRHRSEARVASQPWFRLAHDQAVTAAAEVAKPLSLNESARRRQIAAADEFQNELSRSSSTGSACARRICEITLAPGVEESKADANGPARDMVLCEAENILADYIHLLPAESTGTIGVQAPPAAVQPAATSAAPPAILNGRPPSSPPLADGNRPAPGD